MDRKSLVYEGIVPNVNYCSQALRILPNVDDAEKYIHFVFDFNRHDVIYWGAELC